MDNQQQIIIDITTALQEILKCPVIKANQASPTPNYPYVSFTITTLMVANGGTWGEYEDGSERKPFKQVWSFTVQSDSDMQAFNLAMLLYEYLDRRNYALEDKGIIVERVSGVSNRDSFISIQYERRYGFDVTFAFMRKQAETSTSPELVPIKIHYDKGEN